MTRLAPTSELWLRVEPDLPRTFVLRHPLGLRALVWLEERRLEPGSVVDVEPTVLHVLECQREIERWVAGSSKTADGVRLQVRLRGPLSFSEAELARVAPNVTAAQLESAVALLLRWTAQAPTRLSAVFGQAFIGLTPWTTITHLREHLDGIRRHGLVVDPLRAFALERSDELRELAKRDGLLDEDARRTGLTFRFQDPMVATIVEQARAIADVPEMLDRLERALAAVGIVPRPKGRRLRLLPQEPEKGERRGHIREVALTHACNLACGFCTSRGPEPRSPRERAARAIAAVRAASREGGTTLVLTGAEPTLEWYLDDLISLSRDLGFERVVLETNGVACAEPGVAKGLAASGLQVARIALSSFDASVADGISRTPGALERALAGVRALLDHGVAVELAVALLPENIGELARIVESATRHLPSSNAQIERVVARVIHSGPELREPLSVVAAARELIAGVRASQQSGLPLSCAPGGELPPCVFESTAEVASLLRLSEGSVKNAAASGLYVRIPLCAECGAREVCPGPRRGLETAVAAAGVVVPVDAPGIPPTGQRKRVLRELVSVVPATLSDGTVTEQRVVRINFHCNQACDFCFVSRELPAPEEALVLAEIAEAARRGATLSLSGGEPTLNARLIPYIKRARELGIEHLDLQTNAIKMSDPAYANALAAAGLETAFVSLHGTTAATCDRVTVAPGTFVKTVEGIKNLLRAGVLTRLNFVLCGHNASELADWPDFVATEFLSIRDARVQINFSFAAASTVNVPRDTTLLPRFSEVAWALQAALDRADALGMPLLGFDSQCGVPACFLPARVREAFFTQSLPDGALRDFSTAFRKGDACGGCALNERCYGVRVGYAEMYGTGELRAVERAPGV